MRRLLCALVRHRTRVHSVMPFIIHTGEVFGLGDTWQVTGEARCWCGERRYLEGRPL